MRPAALLLLAAAACAEPRPGILSYARQGHRILFQLSQGAAELDWITPSTFRYRRTFASKLSGPPGAEREAASLTITESDDEISFSTQFLVAGVRKDDLRVRVRKVDGGPLMADLTAARAAGGAISWQRAAAPQTRYYGLGARTGDTLNLRGAVVRDATPFLISSAGYGEYHVAPGRYDFDLERYRIEIRGADTIDYYFFYGPTPKEIFEERQKAVGAGFTPPDTAGSFRRVVEQSLSGVLLPPDTVAQPLPADLRARLEAFFAAYLQEGRERGFPILHALPFQFPRDAEADRYPDEAMLGDELLIGTRRRVYLPMGIWTDLGSNQVFRGRQAIDSQPPAVFARNGTILPLAGAGTLELHYFPRLAAEFFLLEEETGDYSQAHAAPAADIMRLEMESKVSRDYTWVVHHLEGVAQVAAGDVEFQEVSSRGDLRDGAWFFDTGAKNLYVRAHVAAGQDHIVNLSF